MISAIFESLKNLFSQPKTYSYPAANSPKKAKDYRGLILFDEQKCISCLQCEDVCPPRAIRFVQNIENGDLKYYYNAYLCIYCGECVRICPDKAQALSQSEEPCKPSSDIDTIKYKWKDIEIAAIDSKIKYKNKMRALKDAKDNTSQQTN